MSSNYKRMFTTKAGEPQLITVSNGNKKLIPNEKVKFIIFNQPAVVTCPGATTDCIKYCYADKAERIYKAVKECRYNNLYASQCAEFALNMLALIDEIMNKKSYKNAKLVLFRVHESGDFYNQTYFNKWLTIAEICGKVYKNLVFIAYTKSFNFIHDIPANFVVRASEDKSTPEKDLALIRELSLPVYRVLDHFTESENVSKCRCADCATCALCANPNKKIIECEIH